jgi:hypothetical protein
MTEPILLICGCQKYKLSLEQAIIRFTNPVYKVIGILGDINSPTHLNGSLLSLQVEDTYETCPAKIQAAFRWIYENYPNTPGIFKTDEDIFIDDPNKLGKAILDNIKMPYWGFRQQIIVSKPCFEQHRVKYSDKSEIILPAANYLWGHGYWVSKSAIKHIVNSTLQLKGQEDVIIGSILNKAGIFPKQIAIKYNERPRDAKCERAACPYKMHTNPTNNSGVYCCMMCQNGRNHGPACERNLATGLNLSN